MQGDTGEPGFPGRYFGAARPGGADARVVPTTAGLEIRSEAGEVFWPVDAIRSREGGMHAGGVQLVREPEGDVLQLPDHAALHALKALAPQAGTTLRAARRRAPAMAPLAWLAAGALALAVGVWLLLPVIAGAVAAQVPVAWEEEFGRGVAASMAPREKQLADTLVTGAVERMVARLTVHDPGPYRYTVQVVDDSLVNAFAAPGGYISVHRGLIALAETPEEVAGVLAHEIEHVRQRHVTRTLFQRLSLQLLVGVVLGDAGSALGGGVEMARVLGELSFSREAERQADAGGARRMAAAGLDPDALLTMLERMRRQRGADGGPALELLSTHPATESRIAELRTLVAGLRVAESPPLLEPAVWQAIQQRVRGR